MKHVQQIFGKLQKKSPIRHRYILIFCQINQIFRPDNNIGKY